MFPNYLLLQLKCNLTYHYKANSKSSSFFQFTTCIRLLISIKIRKVVIQCLVRIQNMLFQLSSDSLNHLENYLT